MISLEELAQVTASVVTGQSVDSFQPILLDPISQTIRSLSEIPDGIEHSAAVREWAGHFGLSSYAVAFQHLTGIALVLVDGPNLEKGLLLLSGDRYQLLDGNFEF